MKTALVIICLISASFLESCCAKCQFIDSTFRLKITDNKGNDLIAGPAPEYSKDSVTAFYIANKDTVFFPGVYDSSSSAVYLNLHSLDNSMLYLKLSSNDYDTLGFSITEERGGACCPKNKFVVLTSCNGTSREDYDLISVQKLR